MKPCSRCNQIKPLTDFYRKTRYPDGFDYTCKKCLAPYEQAKRDKKKLRIAQGLILATPKIKVKQSVKTKKLKSALRSVIKKNKLDLYLNQITEEEFNKKILQHQIKIKESILLDKFKHREKLKKDNKKRLDRDIRRKIKLETNKREKDLHVIERIREREQKREEKTLRKKAIQSKYEKNKRKNNILFRLAGNLRHRTNMALKNGKFSKNSHLYQYLGCTIEEFRVHLESNWQPGMTWYNYGNKIGYWNMDHTIPLASAVNVDEIHTLCHFSNIRPMWAILNCSKGAKLPV